MMRWLLRWVILGQARLHPLRALVAVVAIAAGVALGYAVHLINASALAEFTAAVRQVTGQSDASIVGPREGFDETVYERLAGLEAVQWASPVLEIEAALVEPARLRGRALTVLGVDALRAARLVPALAGAPARDVHTTEESRRLALLGDGLFLSPAALEAFALAPGDEIGVQVGGRTERLRVVGTLPAARAGHVIATVDLAYAQWRFDRLGRLTRIDLQLAPGARLETLAAALRLPAGVFVESADAAQTRVSALSRAYRVNLNVLALVALFTGAFLVYSLQSQAVAARSTQLAFLRVAGLTAAEVERLLLAEAITLGGVGAAFGTALGIAVAAAALRLLGGDLGGGYFPGVPPALVVEPLAAAGFFLLGVAAAAVGGWWPARSASRLAPAPALKAAVDIERAQPLRPWLPLGLLAAAVALLAAPPIDGVPVAAYAAIGALLVAAIALKPHVAPLVLRPLARALDRARPGAAPWLALQRLAAAPRFAAIGAAGIVASFALMAAMATMVTSFRASVDEWLDRVLPADVYARAGPLASPPGASTAVFNLEDQQTLRAHPAVVRAEFSRHLRVVLDPLRPPVTLIARSVDRADAARSLPLASAAAAVDSLLAPAWVSEPMAEIYGLRVGETLALPLAGRDERFVVAGVWRDYARQFGAVVIDATDYERITGDASRTDAALWLAPGANAARVIGELRAALQNAVAEFAEPGAIKAVSLRIFDRSFAVTYVLEVAAILIGLTGIAATFSAQAIARAREFGMLRHLGVTQREILWLLACEGLLVTALALLLGLAAGLAVAWVLVAIVNPQSFHWTMDLRLPWGQLAALTAALLSAAVAAAVLAGRRAIAPDAVLAVRQDW
jgi:putative ABC transport system permease protein